MIKKKPKRYYVVVWAVGGFLDPESRQECLYYPKWVCEWPDDPHKWGARYEVSPKKEEALEFGRDSALEAAQLIRLRNGSWAMVEEA